MDLQDLAPFFDTLLETYSRAETAAGRKEASFRIGDRAVTLRFAGGALLPGMTNALAHLAAPMSPPGLTVHLWDSASTGVPMLSPPWSESDYGHGGLIRGFNNDRFRMSFHMGSGVFSAIDLETNVGIWWIRDAAYVPYYERGAPILTIFNWWMSGQGRRLVHAAAVGVPEGGVLLVGKGGSGKSSTAVGALLSDLQYAGDDYCLIAADDPPHIHSLYSSAKVNGPDAARYPALRTALSNPDMLASEKALYFLYPQFAHKIVTGFPMRAVLMPKVTGMTETRLVKSSPAVALAALAPSTIFQLSGSGANDFRMIASLVKQSPSYLLELGTDRSQIAPAISRLLIQLAGT